MCWKTGVFQIVYCDSKFWDEKQPLGTQMDKTFRWYVLECPAICIADLEDARRRARDELKKKFGARAQAIIISEAKGQYKRRTADDLQGIPALGGVSAIECKYPSIIFEKNASRPVFFSRC
jgi:hypothetical protein